MKQVFFGCILLLYGSIISAQPPAMEDSIMVIKGKWKQLPNSHVSPDPGLAKSQIAVIEKRIDSFARFFRQAYPSPKGLEAYWYASINDRPLFKGSPSPYAYRSLYKYYYYNTAYKKIVETGETGTWAYVFVNHTNWFLGDSKLTLTIDGMSYTIWYFPYEKGEWKGYTLYEPYTHTGARAIVLTRKGTMPWKPVSQLQYLAGLRKITEGQKQEAMSNLAKMPGSAEDKEKKKTQFTAFFDKDLKTIDDYLNNTDKATLAQQAIVTNWRIFKGKFPTLKDKGAYKLVYLDPRYFDNTLPSHIPQLMVLYWRWNENAPGKHFKEQLESGFPVEQLKAMIR